MGWVLLLLIWSFPTALLLGVAFVVAFRLYNLTSIKKCPSNVKLTGKTIIITGASAGIGKEAAKDFARRGAKVILACRNRPKAERVAGHIRETTGNTNVHVRLLDTSLLASVRAFARDVLETEARLDVLCLNAGFGGFCSKTLTSEGLETTMATNHFGHFLLVNLLSGLLQRTKPSRIVVTSSQALYTLSKVNPKDLNFKVEKYGGFKAYSLSKLCSLMMAKYLAVYFNGKGVTVNCYCPGVAKTEFFEKSPEFSRGGLLRVFIPCVGRTAEDAAQTLIYLAVSGDDVATVSGALFMDCQERKASLLAEDAGLIKKVWEMSEDLVRLKPEERIF